MLNKLRWMIVTVGALVLTTAGIHAFDYQEELRHALLGSALLGYEGSSSKCPGDMVFVSDQGSGFCVDTYEASPGGDCVHTNPTNQQETQANFSRPDCAPVSIVGVPPWTNISRQEAELACVRAGKRLPTNSEWYRAALGTPDKNSGWSKEDCNVNSVGASKPDVTGARELCHSAAGAYDMIGNVWEWQQETIQDGVYKNRALPEAGYILSIDDAGIPVETDPRNSVTSLFADYFWVDAEGVRGMFRGGYWGNKSDAGQYALNVTVPTSFVGAAVGFRCVKNVE